jgi:predicted nucleic acid-binding protein
MLYFDSSYVVKCYLNDPDSERVRDLVRTPVPLYSSALCIPEVSCAIHRRYRERQLTRVQARTLLAAFRSHVELGTWTLVPLSESLLWEVHEALRELKGTVFIRSGDATHLVSARAAGFAQIWTNDRHMLDAARLFNLTALSVSPS